ncbi:MAG: bifunctional DNA-formamidopyrimidine glycosylase/DNA-(apurinic or apyrimidinic site) lyase [Planctomycetota bacterium]
MPELPEVETMCRGIHPIIGRSIKAVLRPKCNYRPISIQPTAPTIQKRIAGKKVSQVTRLGKRVLIHAGGHALILQPKMTGLVSLEDPPDSDHVRLQLDFAGRPNLRLLFWDRRGLGTVELLKEHEVDERIVNGRLGPDALEITAEQFSQKLDATARPIKVALLDQKLLAGVGNLYASEMLHVAKINPAKPCNRVSTKKKKLLFDAMQRILLDAIEQEGSTLSDGTYRNALNDPGSYQNQHLVYDRAGLPCPSCAQSEIQRIVQAQRSTFYCPKCQKG